MLDAGVARRVREALFAQKYNLLLGAGVSMDSLGSDRKPLMGAEDLRRSLCALTGARDTSPLWRVAGLLTAAQVKTHLTDAYHGCKAGPTLQALSRFAWKTAFTLNIDDAVENAYETDSSRVQTVVPINYNQEYETFRNPQELPLIHLHGFARRPDDNYVFSMQEYVGVQRSINGWVQALSGLIISEPFIIAGTSLFEPDLEYFLAHRPSNSDVVARSPSLLIEPNPDAGTRRDCERLRLVLVEAKLGVFLEWLLKEFGQPPTPLALRQPQQRPSTLRSTSIQTSTTFWSEFDFVPKDLSASTVATSGPSRFVFGGPPAWEDIAAKLDVPLQSQLRVIDEVRRWQTSKEHYEVVCLSGLAGSGKSTTVRRIAVELADASLPVFYVKARGGIDIDSAAEFLSTVVDPIVLATDSFTEHGDQLLDVVALMEPKRRVCILAAEREYRMNFVRDVLEGAPTKFLLVEKWRIEERMELIRRYASQGLVADPAAVLDPRAFANRLGSDTAAESVCRILNDFRPLQQIARSLWNDTMESGRPAYLTTALAFFLYPVGIRRDVILTMYTEDLLADLSSSDAPLRVIPDREDDGFLIPANPTLSALLLKELARLRPSRVLDIAVKLASSIAPFVNRRTIKQRTPEARLAARLFDSDGLLPELLKEHISAFYDLTLEKWRWNSRYWEQRALFVRERDQALAIQYARHAVAIERHPYPLTTLAKVLFSAATTSSPIRDDLFCEALDLMEETLRMEERWQRGRTRRAYWVLLDGMILYLQAGGRLTPQEHRSAKRYTAEARELFGPATAVHKRAELLTTLLQADAETR